MTAPTLASVPPLVPIQAKQLENAYTGVRQRECDGTHIQTHHRYPTRHRLQQQTANLLIATEPAQGTTTLQDSLAPSILVHQHVVNSVIDPDTGATLEYRHLIRGKTAQLWNTSFANELGRLANGVGIRIPTGTNTIDFIPKSKVPPHKMPTYGRMVCDIRPHKAEIHRTRLTGGGI